MAYMINSRVSRKHINVVYANAKNGNLRIEKWFMSSMYNLADAEDIIDWNGSTAKTLDACRKIVDAIFARDYATAQSILDEQMDVSQYGKKAVAKMDRSVIA